MEVKHVCSYNGGMYHYAMYLHKEIIFEISFESIHDFISFFERSRLEYKLFMCSIEH